MRRIEGAARMAVAAALATAFAACSDQPRPRLPEQTEARATASERPAPRAQVEVVQAAPRAVIDADDLAPEGAGAVGSGQAAAETGALPPELVEILHQGPGGPVIGDEEFVIQLEGGRGGGDAGLDAATPSVVDDERLSPDIPLPKAPEP